MPPRIGGIVRGWWQGGGIFFFFPNQQLHKRIFFFSTLLGSKYYIWHFPISARFLVTSKTVDVEFI